MKEEQPTRILTQMGWYLDTSLFMDFIDRNIRTGFDNVEEHDGQTLLHIKGTGKTAVRVFVPVIRGDKRFAFELTKTVNMLRNIQLSNGITYFYSDLVKAEVLRALRKGYPTRESSEILNWWHAFCFILGDFQEVKLDYDLGKELSSLALNFPIRKNVQDYIHLNTSKEKGLAFITLDKLDNQIEELRENYYPYIYYWHEVKDKVPIDDIFKHLPT